MALEQIFGVYWSGGAAPLVSVRPTIEGDTSINSVFTLAAGTVTNQEQQIGFDVADVEGVLITVEDNPATTVVLKTNDTGSPGHTKTFPIGGGELFWSSRSPETNPFGSTDVTTTYWTKTGVDEPTVTIRILLNA